MRKLNDIQMNTRARNTLCGKRYPNGEVQWHQVNASATDKFQQWLDSHGASCPEAGKMAALIGPNVSDEPRSANAPDS